MTTKRRVSAPAVAKRPKTRRDRAMPHYDEVADVPRSMMIQVENMRRCIVAKDGFGVSNNHNWVELVRERTRVQELADGRLRGTFVTRDDRVWQVDIVEVDHG